MNITTLADFLEYLPPLEPMFRLLIGLCIGLFIASIMEAFELIKPLAKLAKPLARHAHLGDTPAAAFATAFFSPISANALMSDALEQKRVSKKEVIISNLFNSLPSTITHMPSLFFLSVPVLGQPAVIYSILILFAALVRTLATVALGHFLLPSRDQKDYENLPSKKSKKDHLSAFKKGLQRFLKRFPRLIFISIPIYCIIYYLQFFGVFNAIEIWFTNKFDFNILKPEALSIALLYMVGEMQAAIPTAVVVMQNASIGTHDLVLALLIGNILSTPMCGIRHQLPVYAGYYPARFALILVCINQAWRVLSILAITLIYFWIFFLNK